MDLILLIMLAFLAVAAGLLGWRWARAERATAEALARAQAADERAAATARDLDAARSQLAAAATEVGALTAQAAGLGERCRGLEARLDQDARRREAERQAELAALAERHKAELAHARREEELERERVVGVAEEKLRAAVEQHRQLKETLDQVQAKFESVFDAAAGRALKASSDAFLKLADQRMATVTEQQRGELDQRRAAVEQLVRPIVEALGKTEAVLGAMEKERAGAYSAVRQQVEQMAQQGAALQRETGQLVQALREPRIRGYYGEVQLKRVAELAGMRAYCDFVEQDQTVDDAGRRQRPDMVVRLPNGREVVVDAKANILPYMDALKAATPQEAEACLVRFADGIAAQAAALGKKSYWSQYEGSAEFVVMFVPGDQFVDAALARRPDLLETAAAAGVVLASPSTLIALLRAVSVAFREERLAREAAELLALGKELHERAATAFSHVDKLGETLGRAVGHYNAFVGSYESRLEPTLERFEQIGAAGGKALPELEPVTVTVRPMKPLVPALGAIDLGRNGRNDAAPQA